MPASSRAPQARKTPQNDDDKVSFPLADISGGPRANGIASTGMLAGTDTLATVANHWLARFEHALQTGDEGAL